jgi:hypothetical protein
MRFLDATRHTNVILIVVPLRYDTGKRHHINEEIVNYNRKLHKGRDCTWATFEQKRKGNDVKCDNRETLDQCG